MRTSVMEYLEDAMSRRKVHMTLLDPEKQSPADAGRIAAEAESAGSDALLVGGSTGVDFALVDETVREIKMKSRLPVILFPGSAKGLTPRADAIFFMSMLNSRRREFIIGQQVRGARVIQMMGVEPLPMAYLIVAPGMRVGEVGDADLIQRDDTTTAISYALAAQYLGMRLIYLEAGSGAPEHVPVAMVSAVRKETDIPLIVGGGIRHPDAARDILRAGADAIVTGTIVEKVDDVRSSLEGILASVRSV